MMTGEMPTWSLGDGPSGARTFEAEERHLDELRSYNNLDLDQLRSYATEIWRRNLKAKEPHTERFWRNELYHGGFHYKTAQQNLHNTITNFCFSIASTVTATLNEPRPRPEIVPRMSMNKQEAQDLQDYARWVMTSTAWDVATHLGNLDKSKFGLNYNMVVVDQNGIAYPRGLSVFDGYPDPFARHEAELESFIIAGPVPTRRLRAMFPTRAREILPDGYTSPSYEVNVRPYIERIGEVAISNRVSSAIMSRVSTEDQTIPGSTTYARAPSSTRNPDADTTFLIQILLRDYSQRRCVYSGSIVEPDGAGAFLRTPSHRTELVPRSPSGWCMIQMTMNGVVLDLGTPIDPCFLGLPVVRGVNYACTDRWYPIGDLDHVIPLNRDYNSTKNMLKRSLEFSALPVTVADKNSGVDLERRGIEPGETLWKARGSEIKWLEYRGVGRDQYAYLEGIRGEIETISGVQEVDYGKKPGGVEAGVAIRQLQAASLKRVRSKGAMVLHEQKTLLKKLMMTTAKKARAPIAFRAPGMQRMVTIAPETLALDYDIEWADGDAFMRTREELEERAIGLYTAGAIDEQYLYEAIDLRGREELQIRMAARRMAEAQMAADAAAKGAVTAGGDK